jgi:hypothetical protein
MQLFLPNVSVDAMTQIHIQKKTYTAGFRVALFVSNHTPVLADTLSTYTAIEATVTGYAQQSLVGSTYVGSTTGGVSAYSAPDAIFTFSVNVAVQSIYGIFYIAEINGSDELMGAVLLPSPVLIPPAGGSFTWTPTWGEQSL